MLSLVDSISNSFVTSIKLALSLALGQFLLQINPVSIHCFFLVTKAGNEA